MEKLIDFSNCKDGLRAYGGSDSKLSLEYNGEKYMVKFPEHKEKQIELQTSSVNNVLSEYIGSHIMASLGIETHKTLLGTYRGQACVACKDFCGPNEQLHEFAWYMKNMYTPDQIGRIPTYEQVYDVMEHHPILHVIRDQAIGRYWETFVGDALIGNFDRHRGNWGYIINEKDRTIRLAPVYDCGSCLYPNLSEDGMREVLASGDMIRQRLEQFPKPALNRNTNVKKISKYGYGEMLSSGMDQNCTNALKRIWGNISLDRINRIIENTPLLSDIRIEFYETMIRYRKELILDKSLLHLLQMERGGDMAFADVSTSLELELSRSVRRAENDLSNIIPTYK